MATIMPLVVIVGPTASGKSALAMKLALQHNGEIIAADSRTVYRGLDIGTAKPSLSDQRSVAHHLIDVVNPDQRFSVADFQAQAQQALAAIRSRGKLPIMVGGTGLYIDSIVFDYDLSGGDADQTLRAKLQAKTVEQLQVMLKEQHIPLPYNSSNPRHLTRLLEKGGANSVRQTEQIEHTIVVGIATSKEKLELRIKQRASEMFANGVVDEAKRVAERYGWSIPSMSGNIYPVVHQLIEGTITLEQAIERSVILDRQLAKRQMTWFRRNQNIVWCSRDEAYTYLESQLIA